MKIIYENNISKYGNKQSMFGGIHHMKRMVCSIWSIVDVMGHTMLHRSEWYKKRRYKKNGESESKSMMDSLGGTDEFST